MTICTWLHYWERDGKLFVLLRLSREVCTDDTGYGIESNEVDWIVAR